MQGRLLLGVPFNGQRYFDFRVRLLTLGGECRALELIDEAGLSKDNPGVADKMLIDLAYLIQQVDIDGIPTKNLTPKFLLDNLSTDDYVLITEQINALRKKHIAAGDSPAPTKAG